MEVNAANTSAPDTTVLVWHEVADTHPAARTHVIHKCNETDHISAAAATLGVSVALVPLSLEAHDRFVREGGWSAWRALRTSPGARVAVGPGTSSELVSRRWPEDRPV